MVRFELAEESERYAWYAAHGRVYRISDGTGAVGYLYWAYLGADGIWVHLDVLRAVSPLWAAAALRLGMRALLAPHGLVMCQALRGSPMERLLPALGFVRMADYRDADGEIFAVFVAERTKGAIICVKDI